VIANDFGKVRASDFLSRTWAHRFLRMKPMPTNRFTVRRIREVLRLRLQAGLSYAEVGGALKISKSSAGKYVSPGARPAWTGSLPRPWPTTSSSPSGTFADSIFFWAGDGPDSLAM
jgi:hypothetical protein